MLNGITTNKNKNMTIKLQYACERGITIVALGKLMGLNRRNHMTTNLHKASQFFNCTKTKYHPCPLTYHTVDPQYLLEPLASDLPHPFHKNHH